MLRLDPPGHRVNFALAPAQYCPHARICAAPRNAKTDSHSDADTGWTDRRVWFNNTMLASAGTDRSSPIAIGGSICFTAFTTTDTHRGLSGLLFESK
jgi:hypothetical protein